MKQESIGAACTFKIGGSPELDPGAIKSRNRLN